MDKQACIALMAALIQAPDMTRQASACVLLARRLYEAVEAKLAEAKEGKPVQAA